VSSAGGRISIFLFFGHGTQREKQKSFSLREKDECLAKRRIFGKIFMQSSKIPLDNKGDLLYDIKARGKGCNATTRVKCDEAGDCATGGNFRGVCPVIGRLRALLRGVYRRSQKFGRQASAFFHGWE
jgi:hypothetical protein